MLRGTRDILQFGFGQKPTLKQVIEGKYFICEVIPGNTTRGGRSGTGKGKKPVSGVIKPAATMGN